MKTDSNMADGFAVVQIQIVFDFRLAETILHRPVQHAISAGRCDIELIPPSQCRCIAKREALEQRSISGDRSALKGEKQSVFVVCECILRMKQMALIDEVAV